MLSKKQFMILSCSDILQVFFRIFFIFTEQENVVRETVHDPLLQQYSSSVFQDLLRFH